MRDDYVLVNITGPDMVSKNYTVKDYKTAMEAAGEEKMGEVLQEEARRLNETVWPFLDLSSCAVIAPLPLSKRNGTGAGDPNDPNRRLVITQEQIERIEKRREKKRLERLRLGLIVGAFVLNFPNVFGPVINAQPALKDRPWAQGFVNWGIAGTIAAVLMYWRDIFNFLRDVPNKAFGFWEVLSHTTILRVSDPIT